MGQVDFDLPISHKPQSKSTQPSYLTKWTPCTILVSPPGAHHQREAGLEERHQDHVPARGRPGAQQDPRRHRVHHQGQAARALQEGGQRPQVHGKGFAERGRNGTKNIFILLFFLMVARKMEIICMDSKNTSLICVPGPRCKWRDRAT